jgi:PLP dependent protein
MSEVGQRLRRLQDQVAAACARAGRPAESVALLAVSKLKPAELIAEAYQAGQRDFGENYAQELRDKAAGLAALTGLRWHAIGPLQSNKARYVAKVAYAFHALDRAEVAQELSRRRVGPSLRCYLEVNLAAEGSKSGVPPQKVGALLEQVRPLPHLEVVGLMCLPPASDDAEHSRPYFRQLRGLADALGLPECSMGTTFDFGVAIEEGADVVRVGTALFGERAAPTSP